MITNFAATSRYRTGMGIPLVIRGPSGGGVRGGPFHSQNPEAYFFHTPGLKVVAPATAYDAKGLMKSAIRDDDPVIYLEHKYLYRRIKETLPEEEILVPIGKGIVRREGTDLTIITYGGMMHRSMEAAEPHRARGEVDGRGGGGVRRPHHREDVRVPGRPRPPGGEPRHPRSLQPAPGRLLHARHRDHPERGPPAGGVLTVVGTRRRRDGGARRRKRWPRT
jgi:hypothetical protein